DFDNRFGFGSGFLVLDAKPFTLTMIYDPSAGTLSSGPTFQDRTGGTTFGPNVANPILDATVAVAGGATIDFPPDHRSQLRRASPRRRPRRRRVQACRSRPPGR